MPEIDSEARVNANDPELENQDFFKDAVCIDAMRIYDSCAEKQCASYKLFGWNTRFGVIFY